MIRDDTPTTWPIEKMRDRMPFRGFVKCGSSLDPNTHACIYSQNMLLSELTVYILVAALHMVSHFACDWFVVCCIICICVYSADALIYTWVSQGDIIHPVVADSCLNAQKPCHPATSSGSTSRTQPPRRCPTFGSPLCRRRADCR